MDKKDTNIVFPDGYNMQEKWIKDVASKYFDLDNENMLRIGLLGYVNEVMSNSIEETNFMTNVYYNEIIPIRANLPDSIYAYASQVKFDGFTANAARLNFIIAIRKKDILNCKTYYRLENASKNEYYVVLEKNSYLELENNFRFFTEYDIQIDVKENIKTGEVSLTSKYIKDRKNNSYEFIPSTISKMNGEEFLFLKISGIELTHKNETFTVYNNDIISTTSFEFSFDGQLSHFDVYYNSNPLTDEKELLTKYFLDELEPAEGTKFCFYRYINENTVEIYFSPYNGYFKPDFNSQISVDIYTTQGSKGNLHFSGNDSAFYISNNHYTPQDLTIVPYVSEPSTGGENVKSLTQIKKKVLDQFSVRHNIITESDLNKFFNDNDKESEVLFVKRRDDIFKRIFSAFILAKDEKDNIIPTNTIRLKIHEDDIDVKDTGIGVYMFKNKKIIPTDDGVFVPESNHSGYSTNNNFEYVNTTLMKFNLSPLSTSHYNIYKNEYKSMDFNYTNSQSLNEFIINDINIFRDPAHSDRYELRFELSSSLSYDKILSLDETTKKYKDTGLIKVRGILNYNRSSIGYIDFIPTALNHENHKIVYTAYLKTTDYIDNSDRINIINSIKDIVSGVGSYKKNVYLNNKGVSLEVCVYYKNGTYNKNGKLDTLEELNEYCLANSFTMEGDLSLFTNLDRMMYTNSKVEEKDGKLIFTCDSVPVVSYDYYSKNGSSKIFNILNFFSGYLKENLNKLENNFDVDIKFFNTYGKSKWFTVGYEKSKLDAVNIRIKLRIKTSIHLDVKQKDIIKTFIKDYLESINQEKIRNIYISNLIRMLENEFNFIVSVEFLGFNDYDPSIQSLESEINDLDVLSASNDILDYVPEYLNLNKLQNNDGEFEPDIYIEYV